MRPTRLSCALLLLGGHAFAQSARAQSVLVQSAEPRLQDAEVTARGSTISITRLPIRTPAGTIYRDVTIELHADPDGRITLATDGAGRAVAGRASGAPARQVSLRAVPSDPRRLGDVPIELPQRPSAPVVFQRFTPGTYTSPDGWQVRLQQVGTQGPDNVPAWSLTGTGPVETATFFSGPPYLNPRAKHLRRAGITAETYAYGTSESDGSDRFGHGAVIGVLQHGRTLQVVSFHSGCCTDGSEPTGSVVYTYAGS